MNVRHTMPCWGTRRPRREATPETCAEEEPYDPHAGSMDEAADAPPTTPTLSPTLLLHGPEAGGHCEVCRPCLCWS